MLLFRSSLSSGGSGEDFTEYGVTVNGQLEKPITTSVPTLYYIIDNNEEYANFNQPITFGEFVGGIFDDEGYTGSTGFFYQASSFNQPVIFPPWMTNFDETFYECRNFNSSVEFSGYGADLTMRRMFYNCKNFNQPLNIICGMLDFSNALFYCHNFNSPINFYSKRMKNHPPIIYNFANAFQSCYNFNQPIDFNNIIPHSLEEMNYLDDCLNFDSCFQYTSFNQPIDFGYFNSYGMNIDMNSMFYRSNFNQPINIDGYSGNIRLYDFLWNTQVFNQEVYISPNFFSSDIGYMFTNCRNLNQPVTLPTFTDHGYSYGGNSGNMCGVFSGCIAFNQPINFRMSFGNEKCNIDMTSVMSSCRNFNEKITFEYAITNGIYENQLIGDYSADQFFMSCTNFNRSDFVLPSFLTSTRAMFAVCTNFNQDTMSVPLKTVNCSNMFQSCNHINNIYIYKNLDFDYTNFNARSLVGNISNALCCNIIVQSDNQDFTNSLYQKIKGTDPARYGTTPTSWVTTWEDDWGCYNIQKNVFIVKNEEAYIEWRNSH